MLFPWTLNPTPSSISSIEFLSLPAQQAQDCDCRIYLFQHIYSVFSNLNIIIIVIITIYAYGLLIKLRMILHQSIAVMPLIQCQ